MFKSKKIKTIISICFVLGLYSFISHLNIYSTYLLPSLKMIGYSFINLLRDGTLLHNILASLRRVFLGYFIAFILAMIIAIAL